MNYLLLTISLLFGLFRGIKEGMVMIQYRDPMFLGFGSLSDIGVRCHFWFKYYHAISCIAFVLYTFIIYLIVKEFPGLIYIIGLLILIWQCSEIGMNMARYKKPIIYYEHINLGDIISKNIYGVKVLLIHLARIASGVSLLIIGGMK